MKIAVPARGKSLDASTDPRFGRCEYFVIVDSDTGEYEALEGPGVSTSGGAGIQTAQALINAGVKVALVENVGPNAVRVLQAGGIEIYSGLCSTVQDSIKKFKENKMSQLSKENVGSHFGLK